MVRGISKKNENLLKEYLGKKDPLPGIPEKKKSRGRGRPRKYAEGSQKRLPGDVTYLIVGKESHINMMKRIAKSRKVSIKQVFAEAMEWYIKASGKF
jgi:hypothetical protein